MNVLVFRSHRAWWAFRVMLQQGLHPQLLVAKFQRAEDLRLCSYIVHVVTADPNRGAVMPQLLPPLDERTNVTLKRVMVL
jgi:hypothetical protein